MNLIVIPTGNLLLSFLPVLVVLGIFYRWSAGWAIGFNWLRLELCFSAGQHGVYF